MVGVELVKAYKGQVVHYKKDAVIFRQDDEANFYYEILQGSVKMITNTADGQEFIQGIFQSSESFGEPPLFCGFAYPSTAIALEPTQILKLPKDRFFQLLKEHFEIHLKFDQALCNRLRYKAMILTEISFYDPEHRLNRLLEHIKGNGQSNAAPGTEGPFTIPFTRQQLADMSGMRVETVIRTVKRMESKRKLKIIDHKIVV